MIQKTLAYLRSAITVVVILSENIYFNVTLHVLCDAVVEKVGNVREGTSSAFGCLKISIISYTLASFVVSFEIYGDGCSHF